MNINTTAASILSQMHAAQDLIDQLKAFRKKASNWTIKKETDMAINEAAKELRQLTQALLSATK